ncbi:MAG: alternative ribosome rescue aminoacyl-tRNA hydrolase ArfB [Bacteroidota bacterium]|nr:alternative ribosome rescue aminoacyl-tRNA hydrolase ArfB [Bacteroidota bacterium]
MYFKPPYLHSEFHFKTSLSGGKGGQHVNKVATKVQLSFDIPHSLILRAEEKEILISTLGSKLTMENVYQVVVQTERSQLLNKEIAIKKLYQAFNKCFVFRKKRKATKPSKGAIERRLQTKKRDSKIKQSRKFSGDE